MSDQPTGIYRVSFLIDAREVGDALGDDAETKLKRIFVNGARLNATRKLQQVREDGSMSDDERADAMSGPLFEMMMTLMAEANWSFEEMPADTVVETRLPFERD